MPLPTVEPPLINSSNPWATTKEDLQALFDCPFTGAVTTRTSLLNGFEHDPKIHQYTFFSEEHESTKPNARSDEVLADCNGSLNTLGYSPVQLSTYLAKIGKMIGDSQLPERGKKTKAFIISVTGSAKAVGECYQRIQACQATIENPLCMEINLSCPKIPDKPPPAYSGESLAEYLEVLNHSKVSSGERRIAIGVKTPPYTYHDQFKTLIDALSNACEPECPIDFITATNTLGSSLVLGDDGGGKPAINSASGMGIGGMAGAPLHPLALGNVKTLRTMLDQNGQLRDIEVIGIGGVSSNDGFNRMRSVGAKVVGVGTALGTHGVDVFKLILGDFSNEV